MIKKQKMSIDVDYFHAMGRQLGLWGEKGQECLRKATVAVGGVGGIGAISALMLAKSGIGRIVISDRDHYDIENIVEQVFAAYDTIGEEKIKAAQREMLRHSHFTKIEGLTGDLRDEHMAAKLIDQADVLISGVDNAEARIMLGKMSAKKNIPMIVSANIGWSILHTVYFPGEYAYGSIWKDVEGLKWRDNFPDMNDTITREKVEREWKIWVVALSGYQPEAIKTFIQSNQKYYWYIAPPAYFAASLGVLDTFKIITGIGKSYIYPEVLYFDMKNSKFLSMGELNSRRKDLHAAWEKGVNAILQVTKSWEIDYEKR